MSTIPNSEFSDQRGTISFWQKFPSNGDPWGSRNYPGLMGHYGACWSGNYVTQENGWPTSSFFRQNPYQYVLWDFQWAPQYEWFMITSTTSPENGYKTYFQNSRVSGSVIPNDYSDQSDQNWNLCSTTLKIGDAHK